MLHYYICVGIVLTVVLVLGLGFGIILYFVIVHEVTAQLQVLFQVAKCDIVPKCNLKFA